MARRSPPGWTPSGGGLRRSDPQGHGDHPPPDGELPTTVLTFVAEAGARCQIFRDTSGGYVVRHGAESDGLRRVATLPCAYSVCLELELLSGQS